MGRDVLMFKVVKGNKKVGNVYGYDEKGAGKVALRIYETPFSLVQVRNCLRQKTLRLLMTIQRNYLKEDLK